MSNLPQQTKAIVNLCLNRDAVTLGHLLRKRLGEYSMGEALSPVRGPVPQCRIFLLHGSTDNVIPPSETIRLAGWAGQKTRVKMLVSDLIQHVELDENDRAPHWYGYWAIIRFWTELLRS